MVPTGVRPLLATLSVERTGVASEIPGKYDSNTQMWVLESGNLQLPIIQAANNLILLETATKSFAEPERDDACSEPMAAILELATKTKAQSERDD